MPALRYFSRWLSPITLLILCSNLNAQRLEIPRRHDQPPGPPISATQAIAKMSVPKGFRVEIVAQEPDLVNPVAMTIDEKGRSGSRKALSIQGASRGSGKIESRYSKTPTMMGELTKSQPLLRD